MLTLAPVLEQLERLLLVASRVSFGWAGPIVRSTPGRWWPLPKRI